MASYGNEMLQLHFEHLKVKNEDWGGEFVDLQPGEDVPNRSVLRAIVENTPQPLVSSVVVFFLFYQACKRVKVDIFLNLTQTLLQTSSVPQKIPSPPHVATTKSPPSGMQTTLHLSGPPVTRTKREVRGRNKELEEDLKQLDQQIMFKEKRRDQAETVRNYKLCDELTEDVGKLKTARREAFNELKRFQRKEKRARWYHEKKRRSSYGSTEKRPRKSNGSGGIFSDSDTPLESPSSVATDATIILSDSGSEMESGAFFQ